MFRGINVGLDTYHYFNNDFSDTYQLNFSSDVSYDYEVLSLFISSFIKSFGLPSRAFVWFLSLVTSTFIYLAARKFRVSYLLTFFFFVITNYYAISLNQSRQIASAAIVLYAFTFLEEQDKKKYLYFAAVLLAASIHISSLLFLPVFFVRKLKISFTKKHEKLIGVLIIVAFAIVQTNKSFFLDSVLANVDQVSVYSHLGAATESRNFSLMGFLAATITIVLNIIICLELLRVQKNEIFPVLFLVTIILEVVFSVYSGNIGRVLYGFSFIRFIAFAEYFRRLSFNKKMKLKEVLFLVTAFYYSYLMIASLSAGSYGVVPYYITL